MCFFKVFTFVTVCVAIVCAHNFSVTISPENVQLQLSGSTELSLIFNPALSENTSFKFFYQNGDSKSLSTRTKIIEPIAPIFAHVGATNESFEIKAKSAGSVFLLVNASHNDVLTKDAVAHIRSVHSLALLIVNAVIGWIYFVAWSVSFYPQVFLNWKRKSVIGLNFDFLAYNFTGFFAYSVFNVGLYFIPAVKHPHGVIQVQINDVVFSLHALLITIVTIVQCFKYERGGQKVSKVCLTLLSAAWLFAFVTLIIAATKVITWLMYLNFFSYIKLGVTLIKYVPQAWMNYRRKSTDGWSIGNVLLDFTGGSFSILQMILLSYNNNDWLSIFGDPTKFGLGLFSCLFDVLFILQHYVLYRNTMGYSPINQQ